MARRHGAGTGRPGLALGDAGPARALLLRLDRNLGRRSPRELRGLPEPTAGEHFTSAMGGRPTGRILSVEQGVALTGEIMGAVMSYVLVPVDAGTTRLLLKVVTARWSALAPLLCLGDLVMARQQLRTFARLAERTS
ncbi:MAG TPA: hypothetical protein VFE65_27615 [Pseudonocardia sp.]|nr:hypothetical protein [Pseudonocardia sp.]